MSKRKDPQSDPQSDPQADPQSDPQADRLETETLADFLAALGINYLVGERKLAVANIIGSASGQLFARIRSQECRDIRVIAALLAAHGYELEIRSTSGARVIYSPHHLPTETTLAHWGDLERVRESRRLREASAE